MGRVVWRCCNISVVCRGEVGEWEGEGMREGVFYHRTPLMLGWRVTSRR